ncbi:hypothetical protein ISF_00115 [Cordyceps fumosorosea ARSEF 2679]|uniref:Uncharacterized protein n=1 Tax=Cordyceps fumosorosea (strain ARSEF 2679) TaxID=1081104 RepID=A0A162LNC5_CORFA|nr:hypothetical protein ISF_00115 [Cordyceps fumosorosea ARSEF 2679]OAA73214.1 hypothetical protein ISF_00115 [Cordyceps fumosorosea ARSEF 2679]
MSHHQSPLSHSAWLLGNQLPNLQATRDAAPANIFVAVNMDTRFVAQDGGDEPYRTAVSEIGLTFLGPLSDQHHHHLASSTPRSLAAAARHFPIFSHCIRASDSQPLSSTEPFHPDRGVVSVVEREAMETKMLEIFCEARRRLARAPGEPLTFALVEFDTGAGPSLLDGEFERAIRHFDSWVDARDLVAEVMPAGDVACGLVGLGYASQRPDHEQCAGNLAMGIIALLASLLHCCPPPRTGLDGSHGTGYELGGTEAFSLIPQNVPFPGRLYTFDATLNVPRTVVWREGHPAALYHHFR